VDLCEAIRRTAKGVAGAKDFEASCTEAVKYLFGDQLTGWSTQHRSEEGMSIYDLVARITPSHDFWATLIDSFRSKYVIFEFKNYADPITQGQIYTTEKYLYATALRNAAIIITRSGWR